MDSKCGCRRNATKEFSKTANITQQIYPLSVAATRRRVQRRGSDSVDSDTTRRCASSATTKSNKITSATETGHRRRLTIVLVAMTLTVLVQQSLAVPLPMQQQHEARVPASTTTTTTTTSLGARLSPEITTSRLRKRHSNWHAMYETEMHPREIEWANPCGGVWLGRNGSAQAPHQRTPVKMILRSLQNNTGREQKTLRITTPAIDISDIRMWSLHKPTYKFLPVLKLNSNVALRRWHRHVQMYVAAFAYLRRAQLHWDYHKALRESEISQELQKLKQSARSILCEIEIAINSTTASTSTSASTSAATQKHKASTRIAIVPRIAMQKRLKFQTPLRHLYASKSGSLSLSPPQESHEVNPIDLKFAKYKYFAFLRSMLKVLRANTRRTGQVQLDSRSASSASHQRDSGISSNSNSLSSSLASSSSGSSSSSSLEFNLNTRMQQTPPRRRNKPKSAAGSGSSQNSSLKPKPRLQRKQQPKPKSQLQPPSQKSQ